jgi:ribosome-binding protein aMBF1 (putative translation factor)
MADEPKLSAEQAKTRDAGQRIAAARKDRNMTQGQLANELRIKQATLSMIESGELEPSDDMRRSIKAWIDSGKGPREKAPRGPYRTHSHDEGAVVRQKRKTIVDG